MAMGKIIGHGPKLDQLGHKYLAMGAFELSMGKTTLAMATFCRPWANLAMAIFSRPWPKCYFFHIVITAKYIHGHYGQSNNDYNFVFNN